MQFTYKIWKNYYFKYFSYTRGNTVDCTFNSFNFWVTCLNATRAVVVVLSVDTILTFSPETNWQIKPKHRMDDPWMVLYLVSSFHADPKSKLAIMGRNSFWVSWSFKIISSCPKATGVESLYRLLILFSSVKFSLFVPIQLPILWPSSLVVIQGQVNLFYIEFGALRLRKE